MPFLKARALGQKNLQHSPLRPNIATEVELEFLKNVKHKSYSQAQTKRLHI